MPASDRHQPPRSEKPPTKATPAALSAAQASRAALIIRAASAAFPADAALREFLASHRRLTAFERRELTRAVFAFCRWRRWADDRAPLPAQVTAGYAAQLRFERDPASFKAEALVARAAPDWLAEEMTITAGFARQIQREPALWLRARSSCLERVRQAFGKDAAPAAFQAPADPGASGAGEPPRDSQAPLPVPGTALRYTGTTDLHRTEAFRSGWFEIQDLASQFVGLACAPRPGETWWDACAGEGGKTLHLADMMEGRGLIWASDRSARRLEVLRTRAGRAQVFNYRAAAWDGSERLPTRTKFDGVLVDAPCSGVGTWQRNPHARWTTLPRDVAELAAVQSRLLANAALSLKPGGRLVYSVCTLTRSETAAVAEAFGAAHPGFVPDPVFVGGPAAGVTLFPEAIDANGMFIAAWRRTGG